MKEIYKSDQGKQIIRDTLEDLYQNWPYPCKRSYIESESYGKSHVLETGNTEGADLILLHGSSSNSASWLGYLEEWVDDFHIYLVDIPGQPGLSSTLRPTLANEETLQWFEGLIDSLGLLEFSLCGMSLGSWIASEYTFSNPQRVNHLCLITSGGFAPQRLSFMFRVLPLMLLGKAGFRRINQIISGDVEVSEEYERFSWLVAKYMIPLTERLPIFSDRQIMSVSSPLMFIGGSKDAILDTRGTAKRISSLLPEAKSIILQDAPHVILDQGKRIREFFLTR